MLKNYLKIAFRNLWKHRAFSLINILGLTVGLTAFFLIFLYVKFELSYEAFNSKADRIYRIVADLKTPTDTMQPNGPAWAVGAHIAQDFPEIESAVRFTKSDLLVRKDDRKFQEDDAMFADSSFFKIFDYTFLAGDPATALKEKFSIVMTKTTAKKYFGDANPIGKHVLITGEGLNATVTGLMEDMPENSQVQADLLISMNTLTDELNKGLDDQWANYGNRTFILLKPGTNPQFLESKLPAFLEQRNGDEMKELQMFPTLHLEPLRDIYLYTTREGNKAGNIANVYIFTIVAIFILLIACFNFVNLTTARSAERAKEVGIRKVVGALRSQLAKQFIGESMIICIIAFLLSLLLTAGMLPLFNNLAGKIVSAGIFTQPQYILILLLIALGIGLLAGLYPALVLSSFQPIKVLKGRFSSSVKGILLRKGLVVTQFTISIALIICTIVVYRQMHYMRSQDLGFSKDQKLVVDTHDDSLKHVFKNTVANLPGVVSASLGGSVPGGGNPGAYSQVENVNGDMQIANLDLYFVDFDYIPQYDMKVLAGRAFSNEYSTDSTDAMVLNESAVKLFGYSSPEQIIGKKFDQWGRKGVIIGVIKDFHFRSLQEVISPLSLRIEPERWSLLTVKVNGSNIPSTISAIESKWKSMVPSRPFDYYFLDEYFDNQYRAEDRFGKLFLNFSILAIFISCLGLLGLAMYSTMQRIKEIGIRKVMGASVSNIINLLSKEFVKLITIAFLIAAPVSWYFMYKWLHGFAYRTDLGWWVFALAGIVALIIAMATISVQAVKAAIANPVYSLRNE